MEIIYKERATGKTTELINKAKDCNGYIVVHNYNEARVVASKAREMGIDINFPITFKEFVEGHYSSDGVKKFYIDNLDLCIQSISRCPIVAVTLTR